MRRLGLEYQTVTGGNTRVLEKRKLPGRRFRFGSRTSVFNSARAELELLYKLLHKADTVEIH